MTVVSIVQARLGSARLPGKALLSLGGRPMLSHVLERASAIRGVAGIVLATSDQLRDNALESVATQLGVAVWRGSEWDVLGRVWEAAAWARADVVVRVTGDCPLLAPEVCTELLERFAQLDVDYVSNDTCCSGFPDGLDCEVMSVAALRLASVRAIARSDREHVTSWIRRECRTWRLDCSYGDWRTLKLSVDGPADFEFVSSVYRQLRPGRLAFSDTLAAVEAVRLGLEQQR